jgi:hypothetical protein
MDTFLPAGPHISNGCFQRRAWESSGAAKKLKFTKKGKEIVL